MLFRYHCAWHSAHRSCPRAVLWGAGILRQHFPNPGPQDVLGGGSEKMFLPRGLKTSGTSGSPQLESGCPQTRPDPSCTVLLPRQGRPQELLLFLAGGKWMGMVQSGPSFELLLWPTPQGPTLTLCEPSLWPPPMCMFFEDSSKKKKKQPRCE